jgi:hypothetical protein
MEFLAVMGFTSLSSTVFSILAYLGLLVFTWGILDKSRQAHLFFFGGIMTWIFAVYVGNPIFIGAQTALLVGSFMRVILVGRYMRVLGAGDASMILILLMTLIFTNMFFQGQIHSPLQWTGALGAVGLVLGVAFAQTMLGNSFFTVGGMLMGFFAYMVWSLPFLVLNIIFTLVVLGEIFENLLKKDEVAPRRLPEFRYPSVLD